MKKIAARSQGDVRSALTDLEVLTKQKDKIRNEDIYDLFRGREESIFYAVKITLKSFDAALALSTFSDVKVESSEYSLWIDQNIHHEYLDPNALRTGYISLSDSDIFKNRISNNQNWGLAYYSNILATAGVQQSKSNVSQTVSTYRRPDLMMKIFAFTLDKRERSKCLMFSIKK